MNKVCIIVGHGKSKSGGYDSGAVSGIYHEFKIAKEIAKECVDYLNANYDIKADLMNYDGDLYLTERVAKVNKADYDFIAEIHLNAGGGTGTETYYYHGSERARNFADKISKEISSALGIKQRPSYGDDAKKDKDKDGGDKTKLGKNGKDYFAIIRDTKPTAVLVETVFIDTPSDLNKVKSKDGQKACGNAIARGIAKAYDIPPVVAEKPVEKPTEGNKLYRVCEGAYSDYKTATERKEALVKAGFKNAYLVEVE